jgi:ubiquinol-cytochrome c reductase cytochrome c subunit
MRIVLAALLLAAVVFTGGGPAQGAQGARGAQGAQGEPERGRDLYLTHCASCHGVEGGGTAEGPSLLGAGAAAVDFQLSTGRMPLARPGAQAVRKPPAFGPRERAALVAYVASLGAGPPVPEIDPEAGELARGGELFRENCAACHGFAGRGGALSNGSEAPSLVEASPLEVAEAIRIGPGRMPVFGPETLGVEQVNSIVRYVGYLRRPDNRGGLGLGLLGPVPEGLVGFFGLGMVALMCRWIERRH